MDKIPARPDTPAGEAMREAYRRQAVEAQKNAKRALSGLRWIVAGYAVQAFGGLALAIFVIFVIWKAVSFSPGP